MAPQVESEIVRLLVSSRDELIAAASGVSESQANVRPEAGRWSVLDCIEHVMTVEERFRGFLERSRQPDAPPVNKQKEAEFANRVKDRTTRVEAPEAVRPTSRFTSLEQAIEQFKAARAQTIQFAEGHGAGLYGLAAEHPRFGLMNGTELLTIVASHGRRHAEQIHEIAAALGKA